MFLTLCRGRRKELSYDESCKNVVGVRGSHRSRRRATTEKACRPGTAPHCQQRIGSAVGLILVLRCLLLTEKGGCEGVGKERIRSYTCTGGGIGRVLSVHNHHSLELPPKVFILPR